MLAHQKLTCPRDGGVESLSLPFDTTSLRRRSAQGIFQSFVFWVTILGVCSAADALATNLFGCAVCCRAERSIPDWFIGPCIELLIRTSSASICSINSMGSTKSVCPLSKAGFAQFDIRCTALQEIGRPFSDGITVCKTELAKRIVVHGYCSWWGEDDCRARWGCQSPFHMALRGYLEDKAHLQDDFIDEENFKKIILNLPPLHPILPTQFFLLLLYRGDRHCTTLVAILSRILHTWPKHTLWCCSMSPSMNKHWGRRVLANFQ